MPIYGCGFLDHDSPWVAELDTLPPKQRNRWLKLWDPVSYLHLSKVPTLWVTGSNDHAYSLEMLSRSIDVCGVKAMLSIHIRYPHSHNDGWKPRETYAFADSFCKDTAELKSPKVKVNNRKITLTDSNVKKATLCITEDFSTNQERYWKQIKMHKLHGSRFLAVLPDGIIGWFVNATDQSGNITSSDITFA